MDASLELSIRLSKRFRDKYYRGTLLQQMADGEIHDFVRAYRANPNTCSRGYDRIESLKGQVKGEVLEFDLGHSHRMAGLWAAPHLTLIELGNHEITGRITKAIVDHALRTAVDAPQNFFPDTPSEFFTSAPSTQWRDFANERSAEWLYYLDDDQAYVAEEIYDDAIGVLLDDTAPQVHLIVGGPGTGKTCILLNLMKRFADEKTYKIHLLMPVQVAEYVMAATDIDIPRFRVPLSSFDGADVLLFDDPPNLCDLQMVAAAAAQGEAKLVVLGVDPLQLAEALEDAEFDELVQENDIIVHELHACYRQRTNVGEVARKTAQVIAQSTPFLDSMKKQLHWRDHERLTSLSNSIEFRNPHGYFQTYPKARLQDLRRELERVKSHPAGHWRHWPPLLIALIGERMGILPSSWQRELDQCGINYALLGPDAIGNAKGVEYQHVFLVMESSLYGQLNDGFEGSGQRVYNYRRLLRIPFSRAKDSLVVMALPHT